MRRLRIALITSLASVAACAVGDLGGGTRWASEFEYVRRGGLCPTEDGAAMCELRVVVTDNGTWTASGVPQPPDSGSLPLGAATELTGTFDGAWGDLTEVPFEGVCPTAMDGEEYGYVVRSIPYGPGAERQDMRVREVWSCWYDLERWEGQMRRNQIETVWLGLKPPELDHVEFR